MAGIKVRDRAVELRMEGIDDLRERAAAVVERAAGAVQLVRPLGVRAEIDGVGVGIGEIKLHDVAHSVAQNQLPGVVAGASRVRPCVERRELALEESRCSIWSARWIAEFVQVRQGGGFVAALEGPDI